MSESFKRVRRFTEIRSANYRSRPGVIETVHEYVGPDAVAHDLTEHDLEQVVTEHAALLAEVEKLRAGHIPLMTLRQTWRNGWMDRARADRQAIADANRQRDAYERAFVRYMSEDPAEDDKDPYRPVDGPDDPAFEQQPAPTVAELHARCAHPSYEYATTQGPRKRWDHADDPPEGDGWERNIDAGRPGEGWERFDYYEESYWRRLRPDATCSFPSCGHPDHQAASDLNGGDGQ